MVTSLTCGISFCSVTHAVPCDSLTDRLQLAVARWRWIIIVTVVTI